MRWEQEEHLKGREENVFPADTFQMAKDSYLRTVQKAVDGVDVDVRANHHSM